MRPLIGITSRLIYDPERRTQSFGVGVSYVESIEQADGIPVLVPLIRDLKILEALFSRLDGVLLSGGEDVHPRFYGQSPHPKLGAVDELRDVVELQLARWCFERDKPLMGLCRGLQVMNVALGGTLIQDIPSQRHESQDHVQAGARPDATSHMLALTAGSLLANTIQADALRVNSFHHQAIDRIAEALVVVGSSEDGLAEAVESKQKKFFVGLQCHPEHLWQGSDERWLKIFKAFVQAAEAARCA